MFHKNSLKKLSDFFSIDNLEHLIINYFKEIMIIIASIGIIIFLIIVFILTAKPKNTDINSIKDKIKKEESLKEISIQKDILINSDDFIIPSIKSFDVTTDYIDFMPTKYFQLPDLNNVNIYYKKILDYSIEDSLKFNFEKRKRLIRGEK